LLQGRMSNALSVQICKKMEEMGLHTHAYDLYEYYSNMDDEPLRKYEEAVGIKAKRILDKPLWKYIEETEMQSFKFLMMVDSKESNALIEKISSFQFPNCVVTKSANFLIEICNAAYSKGTALAFLAERFHIPLENTIAIGDQWNDMPMLEKAGLGLAVANAQPELKQIATALPYSNNEDAVAYVIEKYGYYEE